MSFFVGWHLYLCSHFLFDYSTCVEHVTLCLVSFQNVIYTCRCMIDQYGVLCSVSSISRSMINYNFLEYKYVC